MKDNPQECPSATVPPMTKSEAAKQAEEVCARWAWTDPGVWTECMLTALENGVKGGQWFSLIDKVYAETTLNSAGRYVTSKPGKAAGVDHVTPRHYRRDLCENTRRLSAFLRDGSYRPQKIRRTWIPKPGGREKRPLGIPTVRDRVVQTALLRVIEPIFERDFAEQSYGFRPQRGCKDALRRVDQLLKAGYVHVVDADLKSYFDTIPHKKLMERVKEKISDSRVLKLIEMYLKQDVLDGLECWTPEEGRESARGGDQPVAFERLSEPVGSSHGGGRAGNGSLRRRLCARQCVREMRVGPSQPACGGRLQTTLSCGGQEPLVVSVKEKAGLDLVRCETERRTQVNH